MILQETDWMANSDVTMSDDWKKYHKTLEILLKQLQMIRLDMLWEMICFTLVGPLNLRNKYNIGS